MAPRQNLLTWTPVAPSVSSSIGTACHHAGVAVFLSDEWVDELAVAAGQVTVDPAVSVSVRQVVQTPASTVAWTVRAAGGRVAVDRDEAADVVLTTDRDTAAALVRGELAAQDAFASGRLRVGGDLTALLAHAAALAATQAAYARLRASTTYA
jgi:hypothetical protein